MDYLDITGMKRKKQIFIVGGLLLIVIAVFGIWFFSSDKTEKLCKNKCESSGFVFLDYKTSENYNFIECDCSDNGNLNSDNGNLKIAYFDLKTKEQLTSNQVLNRVIGG